MSEWNPSPKYRELLDQASALLEDEERTVRDVYYALEAMGYDYSYRQVKRALKKGRRAGFIDPSMIKDSSRRPSHVPNEGYNGLREFYDTHLREGFSRMYWENWWEEQPEYLEVWLEKQSLESVFRPIVEEFNVRLECTRGDWSDSKVYEAAERLLKPIKSGKDVTILYFGDYNPSGYHAPVSVQNTLQTYGVPLGRSEVGAERPAYFDISPNGRVDIYHGDSGEEYGSIGFERVAINTEHVTRFDLPPNPNPSSTDKDELVRDSFMEYVSEGRDLNIELNALKEYEREFLEDLIRDSIEERIDSDARDRVTERMGERRDVIEEAVDIDETAFTDGGWS